jgi:hypothetical protein
LYIAYIRTIVPSERATNWRAVRNSRDGRVGALVRTGTEVIASFLRPA